MVQVQKFKHQKCVVCNLHSSNCLKYKIIRFDLLCRKHIFRTNDKIINCTFIKLFVVISIIFSLVYLNNIFFYTRLTISKIKKKQLAVEKKLMINIIKI